MAVSLSTNEVGTKINFMTSTETFSWLIFTELIVSMPQQWSIHETVA